MTDPHSTRVLSPLLGMSPTHVASDEWFFGSTHPGRVRTNNEDRFLCDPERGLFIVADGMGGHAAGEEASRIVIETLSEALSSNAPRRPDLPETLAKALCAANSEVIRQSTGNYQWRGMGSTAVVAALKGDTLYLAHAGDSRAYVMRDGRLHQMSQDHSVAAVLVRQNQIRPEEIRTHSLRNRLTMCLGIEEQIRPETLRFDLEPNDRVLLCSDGLWDMLADDEIGQLLRLHPTPKEAVSALIEAANAAGGKDNITALVFAPPFGLSANSRTDDDSEDTVILRTNADA